MHHFNLRFAYHVDISSVWHGTLAFTYTLLQDHIADYMMCKMPKDGSFQTVLIAVPSHLLLIHGFYTCSYPFHTALLKSFIDIGFDMYELNCMKYLQIYFLHISHLKKHSLNYLRA
jgi:hypothetical protein